MLSLQWCLIPDCSRRAKAKAMSWVPIVLAVLMVVGWGGVQASPVVSGDPYRDILNDPSYRPKPEEVPNITIDQAIVNVLGGIETYMSDKAPMDVRGDITAEMDMVLSPRQFKDLYMTDHRRKKRKAIRNKDYKNYRWTNSTIPYEFIASHFSVDQIHYIKKSMDRWQETTCLKFRPATSADRNRIRFQNGRGCNSQLGMTDGTQPINLENPGCRFTGLYLHEIGHAIGLVHEHQLPDRDEYLKIIYDNVAPSMRIWFNKYSTEYVNQYGVHYEYSSVMHYGVTAFSKDGKSQTIRAKDKSREHEIGRVFQKGLSFSDIKVVNLMYGCNKHCAADSSCQEPAYLDKNCKCVRPDGGIKPGSCSNIWNDRECDDWARAGECDRNPLWMKENCKKSCKACEGGGRVTKKPGSCKNIWNDGECDNWAQAGECDINPLWMKENCKKSCKACGGGVAEKPGSCNNIWNDGECDDWAKAGECDINPLWMKKNCKKSCKTCDGSGRVTEKPGSCNNTWNDGECDDWAQAGECDTNPLWMKENCKKSCKTCDGGGKLTEKPGNCKDDHESCKSWADSGYCANNQFTQTNCKKSCDRCDDSSDEGGKCKDDHESCKSWADSGYCATNQFTQTNCKKSCDRCDDMM